MKEKFEIAFDVPAPKNFKWVNMGMCRPEHEDFAFHDGYWDQEGDPSKVYPVMRLVRTNHDSGIPIDLPDIDLEDHGYERIEYVGKKPDCLPKIDRKGCDKLISVICGYEEWDHELDMKGDGTVNYYCRVWFKEKELTIEEQYAKLPPAPCPEGYEVELLGWGYKTDERIPYNKYSKCSEKWIAYDRGGMLQESRAVGKVDCFYIKYVKIKKPTTLKDLVGEDGQKNLWLIDPDGWVRVREPDVTSGGKLRCNATTIDKIAKTDTRWSHSPFVSYSEANEFVL